MKNKAHVTALCSICSNMKTVLTNAHY